MIVNKIKVDESISLKLLILNDAPVIYNAIDSNRHFLRKWLPFIDSTKEIQDTRLFIQSILDDSEQQQKIFTIWFNHEYCGLIGLKDIDYINRKVELGYWIIEKMTGKGIITKSVKSIINFCFTGLEMNRIQIKCGVGNIKSSAVPKRIGFTFEGIERQGEKHLTHYINLEIYSLLKDEWI